MKRTLILALVATSAFGFSQSRSSFLSVSEITGITYQQSNEGLSYLLSVGENPQFTHNNVTYDISEVFGFWALKDSNPDTLNAVNTSFGIWSSNNNSAGNGQISGWKTNPNAGLTAGESQIFTYEAIDASKIDRFGLHVRLESGTFPGTSGNTGHITGTFSDNIVPEPATMAVLGLGIVPLLRKRRK